MEAQRVITSNRTCPVCNFEFTRVSAKNEHIRNIHKLPYENQDNRKMHIVCPLCRENKLTCGTYNKLQEHLEQSHSIKVHLLTLNFSSKVACGEWLEEQKIETKYTTSRTRDTLYHTEKNFMCNRSNLKGFESKCKQRREKNGGSIKMYGVCPSRLTVKVFKTGECSVQYWTTHVGHEEDIRRQHLSHVDKTFIVEKLFSGITPEEIISDATQIRSDKPEKINTITKKHVIYLMKKHGVQSAKERENKTQEAAAKYNAQFIKERNNQIEEAVPKPNIQYSKEKKIQEAALADEHMKRKFEIESLVNYLRNLDEDTYNKCMDEVIRPMMREIKNSMPMTKMEEKDYPARKIK